MQQIKGYLLIAAASIIWGTMGIFGKLAFEYGINPVTLTALRIIISSSTMLFALVLFSRNLLKIEKKDLPQLIVFGVLAVALQRVAYFYTVDLTTATIAAVMFYTYPVFVTVYASIFLKEKITSTVILAIVLAFSGVALVVKAYEAAWLNTNFLGLSFGIITSLLFALYFLMAKKLRNRYTNWTLLLYGDGIGAIALLPTLFFSSSQIITYPPQLWTLILVIGLFPSLTAYLLFSYALKYVESAKGSILSIIEPLSAAAFSITILGEKFEIWQATGVALALTGILLLFYKPKPKN
ncbi:MAG: DMT family transporter [Candidatus Bathyarchaeota archaeon]|jgi:drug/metabolite transporter (DMT)-like permease|nr:DMT family transporter [Candidatus Bathyarchaeota archaeon]